MPAAPIEGKPEITVFPGSRLVLLGDLGLVAIVVRWMADVLPKGIPRFAARTAMVSVHELRLPTRWFRSRRRLTKQVALRRPGESLEPALGAVARVRPEVVVLDHALSANDVEAVLAAQERAGFMLVTATTDLSVARRVADEVLVLSPGAIWRGDAKLLSEEPPVPALLDLAGWTTVQVTREVGRVKSPENPAVPPPVELVPGLAVDVAWRPLRMRVDALDGAWESLRWEGAFAIRPGAVRLVTGPAPSGWHVFPARVEKVDSRGVWVHTHEARFVVRHEGPAPARQADVRVAVDPGGVRSMRRGPGPFS